MFPRARERVRLTQRRPAHQICPEHGVPHDARAEAFGGYHTTNAAKFKEEFGEEMRIPATTNRWEPGGSVPGYGSSGVGGGGGFAGGM